MIKYNLTYLGYRAGSSKDRMAWCGNTRTELTVGEPCELCIDSRNGRSLWAHLTPDMKKALPARRTAVRHEVLLMDGQSRCWLVDVDTMSMEIITLPDDLPGVVKEQMQNIQRMRTQTDELLRALKSKLEGDLQRMTELTCQLVAGHACNAIKGESYAERLD